MKDYDYNQMLDDYQFLNQIGRVVSSTGRSLGDAHMLPQDATPGPGVRRGPASQQRRDALAKQLGFHKLPIMLLPDGMSRRKMNRTHWDAKQRSMLYTIQLQFPCHSIQQDTDLARFSHGILVHGLVPSTVLATWVLSELEQQCARQHQLALSQWHSGLEAGEPKTKRCKEASTFWRMDPAILASLGLRSSDSEWSEWPSSVRLLLRIYELRLRNETTSKYLDWWQCKGAALEKPMSLAREAPALPPALVPQHILDSVSQLRPDTQPVATMATLPSTVPHFVEVPLSLSLDTLLRSLPAGFGIVEFLELTVWPSEALGPAQRRGQVQLHPLQEPAPPVKRDTPPQQPVLTPATSTAESQPGSAPAQPLPPAPTPTPMATTLVAYADSDTDDEA